MVEDRLTNHRAPPDNQIEHALRNAGAHDDLGQRMGGSGHEIRGLEHHRVSVGEGRRDFPGRDRDREIPWRNDSDDADRLARDLDVDVRPHAGELLARNSQRFAGEEVEDLAGAGRLADAFGQRLALFAREQAPELVAPRQNLSRDAQEDVMALLRRRSRPGGKRRVRGVDRRACLRGVGLRVLANDVAGV